MKVFPFYPMYWLYIARWPFFTEDFLRQEFRRTSRLQDGRDAYFILPIYSVTEQLASLPFIQIVDE
jgi:hypothetical protein